MTNLENKPANNPGSGDYGFCPACSGQKTSSNWCPECHPKLLLDENPGWTSGNEKLDEFIKETIIKARRSYDYIEWIPYENFKIIKHIGSGGFATAYLATRINCLKGHFTWDAENKRYIRESFPDYQIALKCFRNKDGEEFLNEIRTHHKCMMIQDSGFLQCYGISKKPETNEFTIVLDYAQGGDLRSFLKENHKVLKWEDRLRYATKISKDLKIIHEAGLIHGDFHSGNVLQISKSSRVSDFGLSRTDTDHIPEKGIYGVIPYVAPEVLSKKPYRQPSDVYSFGIIMCEIASGKAAFSNEPHDTSLALKILNNYRPKVPKKTPECYIQLMKKCLNGEPKERPKAAEIYETCLKWHNCVINKESEIYQQFKTADEDAISEDDNEEYECNPKAIYSSRLISYVTTQTKYCIDEINIDYINLDD